MKKRVFIIHGWGGTPKEGWLPWLKNKLEEKGVEVIAPQMPDTEEPRIEEWVSFLSDIVGKTDKDTFFIGHSIGCQTILRFLEKTDEKIGGAIFIAGWFVLENLDGEEKEIAKPWVDSNTIDFEKLKKATSNYIEIISDNDFYGGFEINKKIFSEKLGAKIIELHNMGHIEQAELPIAFEELLGLIG